MVVRLSDAIICNDVTEETPLCPDQTNESYFTTENDNLIQAENCPICFEDSPPYSHPTEPICFAPSPHDPTPVLSMFVQIL